MREHANVAAIADRDAGVECHLERGALPGNGCRLRIDSLLPSCVLRRGIARSQRRAEGDALLLHERKDFRRAIVAVLNVFDPCHDRAPHPLWGGGVRHHSAPTRARRLNHRAKLGFAERRHGLAVWAPPIIGVHLDPVCTVCDLITRHANHILGSVRFLGPLRRFKRKVHAARRIGARRDNCTRRHQHPWAGNNPLVNGLLQPNVRVARSLGAKVANHRPAGHQRVARVVHGARGAQGEWLLEDLVVPRGFVVGV